MSVPVHLKRDVHRIDLGVFLDNGRPDRYEEAVAWVTQCLAVVDEAQHLNVTPNDVAPKIAIVRGDSQYHLHLTRYLRNEQGRIVLDVAAERPITTPLVIDLGTTPTWPAWLIAE